MMTTIVFATSTRTQRLDDDEQLLIAALARRGLVADCKAWDDPFVEWSEFKLVVVRSTSAPTQNDHPFLSWAEYVDRVSTLLNPLDVLRWNMDPACLYELAKRGVPVASVSLAPQAVRSLLFIDDTFSHVVQKAGGTGPSKHEYSSVSAVQAVDDEVVLAKEVLRTVRRLTDQRTLTACIDLVRDEAALLHLKELALVEPSLFLRCAPEAAEHLAETIVQYWQGLPCSLGCLAEDGHHLRLSQRGGYLHGAQRASGT